MMPAGCWPDKSPVRSVYIDSTAVGQYCEHATESYHCFFNIKKLKKVYKHWISNVLFIIFFNCLLICFKRVLIKFSSI